MPRPTDRRTRHQQTRREAGDEFKYTGPIIKPEKKRRPARRTAQKKSIDLRGAIRAMAQLRTNWKRILPRVGILVGGVAVLVGIIWGVRALVGDRPVEAPPTTTLPPGLSTQTPRDYPARGEVLSEPLLTPTPGGPRDLSYGAADITFDEEFVNMPTGIYDTEIVYSAGSGSLDDPIMKNLYRYNLDTGESAKIASTGEYKGEIYETLINHNWIVWLDTDHGTNNKIYVYNRNKNSKFMIQNNKNGKPKLQLFGDTLIYMEHTTKSVDSLVLFDLLEQDQITLFSFNDVATYGVSNPCIYQDWVVWAGPIEEEPQQTAQATATAAATEEPGQEPEVSAIYYMNLNRDFDADGPHPKAFKPDTYVNDPLFNGEVFVWRDGNKSPGSKLYISQPDGTPKVIATGVTTYSLGDGIVVYGRDEGVWVYIYDKGETCRLTAEGEKGMLPIVTGRTVVWRVDWDVLRFIILTDNDLYPEKAQEETEDAQG